MKTVCVFCASSPQVDPSYLAQASLLGELLAKINCKIQYGGGGVGLMGALADAALIHGGRVTGIIPHFMVALEWQHKGVKDMVHVETMAERKHLLVKDVDAVIVLPGGTGTLEELFEVLSLKKLGLFSQHIILLNTNDYFNPLIEMMEKMEIEKFMDINHNELWTVIQHPHEVLNFSAQ